MPFLKDSKSSYTKRKIEDSKRNGLRHAIFSPVSTSSFQGYYVGLWKNDVKEGRGKEFGSGWIYEGHWLNNNRHGCGILSKHSEKDSIVRCNYVGEWFAGKKQGFGYNWFKDGSYYEGAFYQNKQHGFGRMWYRNGDYYEGDWKNNLFHGMGLFVKDNGNKYEGHFVKGKKEGKGTFYHIVTGQEQQGLWKGDFFVNGIMLDADFRQAASHPTPYPIPQMELLTIGQNSQQTDIDDNMIV